MHIFHICNFLNIFTIAEIQARALAVHHPYQLQNVHHDHQFDDNQQLKKY